MTPDFSISADGNDITDRFTGRQVELTVVDALGGENDSAEIVVADPTAIIEPPRKGAVLAINMGYRETRLVPMGLFKVDKSALKGYPHKIHITARAADLKQTLKERRSKDYRNKTLKQIADEVAGRHGLTARVAAEFADVRFPTFSKPDESYVGQHEESDFSFIERLAARVGGVYAIKANNLIVASGDGSNISGADGIVIITPDMLIAGEDAYEVSDQDQPVHGKVEASYFDRKKAARVPVIVGDGEGEAVYRFRQPFPDETQARKAAEGKARELARAGGTAKFKAWGDATIRAGMIARAKNIRPGVDGDRPITRVEHHMAGTEEFTSSIEAEAKPKGGK